MSYILDVALVLILALCIFIGIKRGFAKMLVRVGGAILALVLAGLLSGQVAQGVFDTFLANNIKAGVMEQVPEMSADEVAEEIDHTLASLPGYVTVFIEQQNIDINAIADQAVEAVAGATGNVAETVVDTVMAHVVRPIAVALLTAVCFLVLLILLLIVVWILAVLVDKIFRLPLLGNLNKTLGALMGVLQGLLWVLLAATVIELIAYAGGADSLINRAVLESTWLTRWIAEINPITAGIGDLTASIGDLAAGFNG